MNESVQRFFNRAMRLATCILVFLCPILVHAQSDVPLDQFIETHIVEEERNFEEREKTASYLRALDPGRLRIVRNAFFAKYGYTFDDSDLQRYFEKQAWYEAKDGKVSLTPTEERNIEFIQSLEDRRESQLRSFFDKFPPCDLPFSFEELEAESDALKELSEIDSTSVDVFLNAPPYERKGSVHHGLYAKYRAQCKWSRKGGGYVLFYVKETLFGGGSTYQFVVSFDETGRLRSRKNILQVHSSEMDYTQAGTVGVSHEDGPLITVKRIGIHWLTGENVAAWEHKREEVREWTWYTVTSDGKIVETEPSG